MTALKWAGKSRDKIEGLLAPYGGPAFLAGKDLDGEFFTDKTDFVLSWFGDWERPLLYHHGFDDAIKTAVVGRIKVSSTDQGLWMEGQLDKAHEYYKGIAALMDKSALGLSSGAVDHLVQIDAKSGEIKMWPLVEGSLTPAPAHPDARAGYAVKAADAIEHLAVLGVEAPDALKAVEPVEAVEPPDEPHPDDPPPDEAVPATKMMMTPEEMAQMMSQTLTPQALHDAAVASGAACPAPSEMEMKSEPAPLLAVAGKSAEPVPPLDLDAFKAHLSDVAVKHARELLGE